MLPKIADGVTRAVVLNSLRDAIADAELDPQLGFDVLLAALPDEDQRHRGHDDGLVGRWPGCSAVTSRTSRIVGSWPTCSRRGSGRPRPAAACSSRSSAAWSGSGRDVDQLKGWLAGTGVPEGLAVDAELRWLITQRLARLGAIGDAEIDAELERDHSSEGIVHATECRASLPTPAAKERAWAMITTDADVANYELYAAARASGTRARQSVTAPYVERYFAEIAGDREAPLRLGGGRGAQLAFPRYSIDERVVRLAADLVADESVAAGIRRAVSDEADDLKRALAVRSAYPHN